MRLSHGIHLDYCTNIHRGESWAETFDNLKKHTLSVKRRVCADKPFAIGLRLGAAAARELADPTQLKPFKRWLEKEQCYVFTLNGFPYGSFHGTRVKEQVYFPDWTAPERLEYTQLLFELLADLLPSDMEGTISTVPVSFQDSIRNENQAAEARANLWRCVGFMEHLCRKTRKKLSLGLELEPCCYLQTTAETVRFFEQMRADHPGDSRINRYLGITYDCCHLAVQYETPSKSLSQLQQNGIRVCKIHLSNALTALVTEKSCQALKAFEDETYLHQVVEMTPPPDSMVFRYKDLDQAQRFQASHPHPEGTEWRVHFHIPLHCKPAPGFGNTADHVLGVLDHLQANPQSCQHLEMETYTWEILPSEMKTRNVADQLAAEYEWTLGQLRQRGLAD